MHANLHRDHHYQNINIKFFAGQIPFLLATNSVRAVTVRASI